MHNKKVSFSKNLHRLRTIRGVTQKDLAETLHVSEGTISHWESGRNEPDITTLSAIASFFGETIESLISSDFSDIESISISGERDKILAFADAVYPIVCSESAMKDPLFVKGYQYTKTLWRALKGEIVYNEALFKRCIDAFSDSYEQSGTIESVCNMLCLLFLAWNSMINEKIQRDLLSFQDNPACVASIFKRMLSGKIQKFTDEDQAKRKSFLIDMGDSITEFLQIVYLSEAWYSIADYYNALRYVVGMIDNENSLETNEFIGNEMMLSIAIMGNPYALKYYQTHKDIFSE